MVSGRVSTVRKPITAPAATYQKNRSRPASLSAWITSGAVPPNTATVRLYQAPMPRPRSSVGEMLMIAAMEPEQAVEPEPGAEHQQQPAHADAGENTVDSGTISTAIPAVHTSICGLRPNRSESQPKGYCSTTNSAVAIDSAVNTCPSSAPWDFTAYGASAEKNVVAERREHREADESARRPWGARAAWSSAGA